MEYRYTMYVFLFTNFGCACIFFNVLYELDIKIHNTQNNFSSMKREFKFADYKIFENHDALNINANILLILIYLCFAVVCYSRKH